MRPRPLRILNGIAAILIVGGVVARMSWAHLPEGALRAEMAFIVAGLLYSIPAILVRAGPRGSDLRVQAALMAVNTLLVIGVLGVAAPYLPDFLPLACFVLASLTLNFDLGLGSKRFLAVSAMPGAGLVVLWTYYVTAVHGPLGPALVWGALLLGVTALAYLTLRILEGRAASAGRQARSLLRSIGDMGEGLIITERGRLVACNQAYVDMTGYTREALFALPSLLELSPEPERTELGRQLAERLQGATVPVHYEASLVRKDGAVLAVENSVRIVEGDPQRRLIAIVRDVSARRRAEAIRSARFAVTTIVSEAESWEAAAPGVLAALARELGWDEATYREAGEAPVPDQTEVATRVEFPILAGATPMGTVELRSAHVLLVDEVLIEGLADIGGLIGEFAERKRAEAALRDSEQRMRVVLESVAEAILTVDEQGTIVSANSAVRRLFGRSPEELGGQAATALVEPKRAAALAAHLAAHRAGQEASAGGFETVGLRRDGSTFPMDLLVAATQSGERRLFVLSFRDTTEQRAQMDALEYRALHDPLTGLPNRTLFADRLGQALQMAARQDLPFAVLVLDLDDFKDVNDELGHDAGDRLLAQASDRLRSACRAADTVARLGGDEFAVLMGPVADGPNAPALARKMLHALGHPFEVAGGLVRVRASIGIARYPEHAADAGALLRCADAAMYAAKRSGEGFAVYRPELERAGDSSLLMFGRGGT